MRLRYQVSLETASMLKYSCNAFHALKIAFANEIDTLAAMIGADWPGRPESRWSRTSSSISRLLISGRASPSAVPACRRILRVLEALARENHQPLPLLSAVLPSNRQRLEEALETILAAPACRLAFIGLSFKTGSDDLRDSPYVELAERLLGKGFEIKIYD